uniref:basic leucine zipper transcriptional factor ATF-like 3 n=1 Tax=Doryrhamphus excisus TaxID=161450 RepID=UPI0025AE14E2|nr:basic leucine zipper transcriptional factor ATF-like 3 [Doryrhamphus excisus]
MSACSLQLSHQASSEDEDRKMKRREKNRSAAQKSRNRQTQRADMLHQTCEELQQKNTTLRKQVVSLYEEQRLLTEALRIHDPVCPIMHCLKDDVMTSCTV